LPFREDVIWEVRNGMRETVLSGTAQLLKDLPVPAAAKTGTTEVVAGNTVNSLFTAFAPFQAPEVSITVLMEGSASNQGYATRAAQGFLQWYFQPGRSEQASLQTE
jgi:cell division protein FtsI/penicillin-binding protein 2